MTGRVVQCGHSCRMPCGPLLPTRPETVGGEGRGDVPVPSAGRTLAAPGRVGGGSQVSGGGAGGVGRGTRTRAVDSGCVQSGSEGAARLCSDGARVSRWLEDGQPRPDSARVALVDQSSPVAARSTVGLGAVSAGPLEDTVHRRSFLVTALGTRVISRRGALTARAAAAPPTFPRLPHLHPTGSLFSSSRWFLKPEEDGPRGVRGVWRREPGRV